MTDRDRCLSEIARLEASLRSGDAHEMEGRLQGLQDWCAELREIEREERKPLCIELFAGLHGWGAGFVAEGYRVIGFDIVDMGKACGQPTPDGCQLVIQDVLTLHGSQFKDAAVIVASPPCQNYSYLAMPWSRSTNPDNSKAAKALRKKWETEGPDNRLFDACFRIQREAIEAAGHYIPLVIENVRGAQPWVGRSAWNFGSYHLWGDVPALMPVRLRGDFNKISPDVNESIRNGKSPARWTNSAEHYYGAIPADGTKIGGDWFSDPKSTCWKHGSRSAARKMASAQIAKIPLPLSQHIASVYKPREAQPCR